LLGAVLALLVGLLAVTAGRAQPPALPRIAIQVNTTYRLDRPKPIKSFFSNNELVARIVRQPSPTVLDIAGLTVGTTTITLTYADNTQETFEIEVVQINLELVRRALRQALPTANINVEILGTNGVILTGIVERSEDVTLAVDVAAGVIGISRDRVANGIRVWTGGGVQQVQLDVCIARVNRSEARELGFSFLQPGEHHFLGSTIAGAGNLTGTNLPTPTVVTANLNGVPNLSFGVVNDRRGILGFLNAMRNEGLAKILAQPTVVTQSGHEAFVVSGGRTPVLTATQNGVTVDYQLFGTLVRFTPSVLGHGRIRLDVRPEVSSRNAANDINVPSAFGTTVVPGFDTQQARAVVELETGQTLALGGLISHNLNASTSKVPILGDIPFFGAAFRTITSTENEEELLILVTPYLVDAMTCDQLPGCLPGQDTRTADDFELFLEGILEAPRGQREVCQGKTYVPAWKNSPTAAQFPCAGPDGHGLYPNGGVGGGGGAACPTCPGGTALPVDAPRLPADNVPTPRKVSLPEAAAAPIVRPAKTEVVQPGMLPPAAELPLGPVK
jgi:pilus assembly protein CpaC